MSFALYERTRRISGGAAVRCIRWLCDWRMEMCDELKIGTQWFDRIGDVRAALPGVEIIKSRHYEKMPPDEACLCGVDICATLVQAGYDYDHEPGSGHWVVFQ